MNIMITGCLGHIGSYLLECWADSPNNIIGVDNLLTQRYCSLFATNHKNFTFLEKNVRDVEVSELENIDVVIHLASLTDAEKSLSNIEQEQVNISDTTIFIDKCKKAEIPLFIFPSSTSVYGVATDIVYEDDKFLQPQSPYAESKIVVENLIREKFRKSNTNYLILRLGTIFGASIGMRFHTAINKFCYQASFGRPLTVWRQNYEQVRPYLGLNDLVSILEDVITQWDDNKLNDVYNAVSENRTTKDIIRIVKQSVSHKVKLNMVDTPLLNQYSYCVSTNKIEATGVNFLDSLEYNISNTTRLLRKPCTIDEHYR